MMLNGTETRKTMFFYSVHLTVVTSHASKMNATVTRGKSKLLFFIKVMSNYVKNDDIPLQLYSGMHIYFQKDHIVNNLCTVNRRSPVARWPPTSDVTLLGVHRK